DVAAAINDKMIRRHPHVFEGAHYRNAAEQTLAWEETKATERAAKGEAASILSDVPRGLPGLTRALKLTKRAARVGFDWPNPTAVLAKLHEEIGELEQGVAASDTANIREELGDILFVVANLARKLDVEPEDAIRAANAKFMRRFQSIEATLA